MTGGPRVVITEFMDEGEVARLSAAVPTLFDPKLADEPERLAGLLAEAEALAVRDRTRVSAEVLRAAPSLKLVGRLGVSLDNIDLAACEARGVKVRTAAGATAAAVAEHVLTCALVLVRGRAYRCTRDVAAGSWPREAAIGGEVCGRTLGLLGFGAVAREVARRARAMGMNLLAHDPLLRTGDPAWVDHGALPVGFDDLLARSHVVSLHVPLTDKTRGLLDERAIRRMRGDAVLINTSHGRVADEAALVLALKEGRLGAAALDVFANEPLDQAAGELYTGVPNLLLTPHVAGLTRESNRRVSKFIADEVLDALGQA